MSRFNSYIAVLFYYTKLFVATTKTKSVELSDEIKRGKGLMERELLKNDEETKKKQNIVKEL